MEPRTIQRLLDYYYTDPQFREEVRRAIKEFFARSDLGPRRDKLAVEEKEEKQFNEWFVFDFQLGSGKTLLEDFYERNPCYYSPRRMQIYKDLQNNEYSLWEVLEVRRGEGLKVKSLRSGKEYYAREYSSTFELKKKDLLLARVAKVGDYCELVSGHPYKIVQDHLVQEEKKFLLQAKELNPKIVRDYFIRRKRRHDEGLKKKILDDGKCICDLCGRKGRMGAFSIDKRTGEPLIICLDCHLGLMAEQEGITKKEALQRRKKGFSTIHLFQEVKFQEYLTLKGKEEFNSLEEANLVLGRVKEAWNSLSIEERKSFEEKEDKELRKIYSGIKIDFSDLQYIG